MDFWKCKQYFKHSRTNHGDEAVLQLTQIPLLSAGATGFGFFASTDFIAQRGVGHGKGGGALADLTLEPRRAAQRDRRRGAEPTARRGDADRASPAREIAYLPC